MASSKKRSIEEEIKRQTFRDAELRDFEARENRIAKVNAIPHGMKKPIREDIHCHHACDAYIDGRLGYLEMLELMVETLGAQLHN